MIAQIGHISQKYSVNTAEHIDSKLEVVAAYV